MVKKWEWTCFVERDWQDYQDGGQANVGILSQLVKNIIL